jgi:hypothetical protein
LTEMTDEIWQIEGFYVHLGPDTVILGEPVLGRRVQVRAQAQSNGELVALRLQVEPMGDPGQRPGDGGLSTSLPSPSPTPSPTPTLSPTTEELSDPVPVPSSTPAPTSARSTSREETSVAPIKTQVPTWLQRFRRTPQPRATRPLMVPSLTASPRERLRSAQSTFVASPTAQPLRLRTRLPEDNTPQAGPPRTETPVPTLGQPVPTQPQPERTSMPGDPPGAKPERTKEPEPERPRDPGPEPPRPRHRATKEP